MLLPLWRKLTRGAGPGPEPGPEPSVAPPFRNRVALIRIGFCPELWLSTGSQIATPAEPRLVGDITFSRAVSCLFWGTSPSKSGIGDLIAANGDGFFDELLLSSVRDLPVQIFVGWNDDSLTGFVQVFSGFLDRIEANGEDHVTFVVGDAAAKLDRPLQMAAYTGLSSALEGQPVPVCYGEALSVPAPLVSPSMLDFDVHDGDFLAVTRVRDQGLTLTEGTGWIRSPAAGRNGFRKLASIAGRITADVQGAVLNRGDVVTPASGNFQSLPWTGNEPSGWTATETGGGSVSEVSGGARFETSGSEIALLTGPATEISKRYFWEVVVSSLSAGEISIGDGTDVWGAFDSIGTFRGTAVTTAVGAVRVGAFGDTTTDGVVSRLRVYEIVAVRRLPEVVEYLCVVRGQLNLSEVDLNSALVVDGECPYELGAYYPAGTTIRQAMDELMDSFLGWWWADRYGVIRVGQLIDPETAIPSFSFDQRDVVEPGIQTRLDRAIGYSSICAGLRNWHVHSDSELAGAVTAADRVTLTSDFRIRRIAGGARPAEYSFGDGATLGLSRPTTTATQGETKAGVGTLLTVAADVQSEADRRGALYADPRRFWDVTIAFENELDALEIEPGDVVELVYPRFGLENGKSLLVVSVAGRIMAGDLRLTLWG